MPSKCALYGIQSRWTAYCIWVLRTWNVKLVDNAHHRQGSRGQAHVTSFVLSGNGEIILLLTRGSKIRILEAQNEYELLKYEAPENCCSIALSNRGHMAAYGSKKGTVGVWDPERHFRTGSSNRSYTSFFQSCGGQSVVDNRIRLWDTGSKRKVGPDIEEQSRFTHDVALGGNGELIIHTNIYGLTKIWTGLGELTFQSNFDRGQMLVADPTIDITPTRK